MSDGCTTPESAPPFGDRLALERQARAARNKGMRRALGVLFSRLLRPAAQGDGRWAGRTHRA